MQPSARELWNCEYRRGGIPSSYRGDPSTVLKWALHNWPFLTGRPTPLTALDSGCGTGRNARHLADCGAAVVGLDISDAAIGECVRRGTGGRQHPAYLLCDVTKGLPLRAERFDLVCDIFVYKHIVDSDLRAMYRGEIARVLAANGRLLLSLAEERDEYYAGCPDAPGSSAGDADSNRVVLDPAAAVQSVLFSKDSLVAEMSDVFVLEMCWDREQLGIMHGRQYVRRTMATIWRARQ